MLEDVDGFVQICLEHALVLNWDSIVSVCVGVILLGVDLAGGPLTAVMLGVRPWHLRVSTCVRLHVICISYKRPLHV